MVIVASVVVIALVVTWFYVLVRLFVMGCKMLRGLWQLEKRHPGIVVRSVSPPQPSRLPWLGAGFLLGRWWHR